jgi:cobalt/nickel transport system ATP-binding protein
MISLERVSARYGEEAEALREVSLTVGGGEKVVLLGTNGSGKSTLLKVMNGLVAPSAGVYRYRGEPITPGRLRDRALARRFRREVVLLFQSPDAMLFNPTVYEEVAFGLRRLGLDDLDARVRHWTARLAIDHLLDRAPFRLSGGEKQKVCLAALLALDPQVLLLDEPAASLDPRSTGWLVDFLADLPVTTVVTTHNLSLAPELGERAVVLAEDHRVLHDGPLDPFLRDRERLLAANLVHAHRHRHGALEHRHFHVHDWE